LYNDKDKATAWLLKRTNLQRSIFQNRQIIGDKGKKEGTRMPIKIDKKV
jgi:hypothetical protein